MKVSSRLLLIAAIVCSVLTPAPGNSQETASLVFDTNNGTGGPDPVTGAPFSSVLVPSGEPTRSGSSFQGWYTNPDGTGTWHGAGSSVTLPAAGETVTLYAGWSLQSVTVSMEPDCVDGGGLLNLSVDNETDGEITVTVVIELVTVDVFNQPGNSQTVHTYDWPYGSGTEVTVTQDVATQTSASYQELCEPPPTTTTTTTTAPTTTVVPIAEPTVPASGPADPTLGSPTFTG